PTGDVAPRGCVRYDAVTPPAVIGHRYLRRGRTARSMPSRSSVVASEQGISYLGDSAGATVTIPFSDTAAVLALGPGRLQILSRNGDSIRVDVNLLQGGPKLEGDIRRAVPRNLFIPLQSHDSGSTGSVIDLSRLKLGHRTPVAREI